MFFTNKRWLMLEPLVDHYEIRNENHCIIISIIIGLSRHHYDGIELKICQAKHGQTVHWQGFTWLRANRIKSLEMALQRRLFLLLGSVCRITLIAVFKCSFFVHSWLTLSVDVWQCLAMSGILRGRPQPARSESPTIRQSGTDTGRFRSMDRSVLLQSVFVGSVCFMRFLELGHWRQLQSNTATGRK